MKVFENVPLSEIVYYRIGGTAKYVLEVTNQDEVFSAITFIREHGITDIRIIGMGSNIVFPDSPFGGAVILLKGIGNTHTNLGDGRLKVFAGETMDSLIKFSFQHKLIGLEWAGGLPSTVGGAIRGNAGAFGSEVKDTVYQVEAVDMDDPDLTPQMFSFDKCQFAYRDSFFKRNPRLIILSGVFQLRVGSDEELEEAKMVYQKNIDYRHTHHPMEYPSCGSVFKNIIKQDEIQKIISVWPDVRELSEKKWHNKVSMGYVVNKLGFSGKQIGGAMVSPKHTNYIVNIDHAKSEDVRQLIDAIQESFENTFGFTPEPEVMIVQD